MLYLDDYKDVFKVLIDALHDDEECVNFISDEEGIRELMRVINANSHIVPDLIEFNSEEEGYYYLSIDSSEIDGLSYSIVEATDKYGDFYGLQGLVLVDEMIPDCFEDDIAKNKYINRNPIRISFEDDNCDGDCENCAVNNSIEISKDSKGKINGFEKTWKDRDSSYTFRVSSSNEDFVKEMLNHFNFD